MQKDFFNSVVIPFEVLNEKAKKLPYFCYFDPKRSNKLKVEPQIWYHSIALFISNSLQNESFKSALSYRSYKEKGNKLPKLRIFDSKRANKLDDGPQIWYHSKALCISNSLQKVSFKSVVSFRSSERKSQKAFILFNFSPKTDKLS